MAAQITLTVTNGKWAGKTFPFAGRRSVLIGRGNDCALRLGSEPEFLAASRHHCLITLNDSQIRVRDLGSSNGTLLNGMQIGRPSFWHLPPQATAQPFWDYDLRNGDELRLGDTIIRVGVRTRGGRPPHKNGSGSHDAIACVSC